MVDIPEKMGSIRDARRFERLFNQIRKAIATKRQGAKGTLTPATLRKHLASGADLSLLYGRKPDGTTFTADDLKDFARRAKAFRQQYRVSGVGVRPELLIGASRSADIERCQKQIRYATLYRIVNGKSGTLLHFRTPASDESKFTSHQVKLRLEEWNDHLISNMPFHAAAKKVLSGRISFDCDCGRHQFWYRYMATVGGYAIRPLENAYPKIRNPKLTGACCKHALRVLLSLKGAVVIKMVAEEMRKTAEQVGFGDTGSRFMSGKEMQKTTRSAAAVKVPSSAEAKKAYDDFINAQKEFKKKMREPKTVSAVDKLRAEREAFKAVATKEAQARKAAEQKEAVLSRALLKEQLKTSLLMGIYRDNKKREDVIGQFAKDNNLDSQTAADLAKDVNV